MRRALLDSLQCPGCRTRYRGVAHLEDERGIELGYLTCACRAAVIPIIDGFVFFNEPILHADAAGSGALLALAMCYFGSEQAFERSVEQKMQRNAVEIYASFQPFNEASRALEPLLPTLRAAVSPGAIVLDTYCRTGWTGEWLAGNFPEQHVVSIWEGDSSVLGYRGFRHLLSRQRRAANLDVIFLPRAAPLPFADASVGLLHGHDVLHRYALYPFAAEALRVTGRVAPMVFAHVHLANSEPSPYFDRGGRIVHGREYRRWLDAIPLAPQRHGLVCSEATLFERALSADNASELQDECDTAHYNGLIAILPSERKVQPLSTMVRRFLFNPLLEIDVARRTVRPAVERFDGEIGKLLLRHPIYRQCLPRDTLSISEIHCLAVIMSVTGVDENDLRALDAARMVPVLRSLERLEILRGERVSKTAHELQGYHSHQWGVAGATSYASWIEHLSSLHTELAISADGTALSAADTAEVARRVPEALRAFGLRGQPLYLRSLKNPLLAVTACAAAAAGMQVVIGAAEVGTTPLEDSINEFQEALDQSGGTDAAARIGGGSVQIPVDGVALTCSFDRLTSGLRCLIAQQRGRLLLVDEYTSPWDDFISVILATMTGDTVRYPAS